MQVNIDDTTPTDLTLMVHDAEAQSSILAQGALATRIRWESMTVESLEDLKRELNQGPLPDDRMLLIRDLANAGRHMLMFGDTVIKYDGCTVQDIPMATLADALQTTKKLKFKPDLPWPLVSWTETERGLAVTIRRIGEVRMFRDAALGIKHPERIFLPPLWVWTALTTDNRPTEMRVAVVTDEAQTADKTELYCLPLPNIYPDGKICFGGVTSQIPLSSKPTVKEAIAWEFGRFIGGESNTDLLTHRSAVSDEVYNRLESMAPEVKKRFDKYISNVSTIEAKCALRVIAMLTLPTGWAHCEFEPMSATAKGVFL